MKTKTMEELLAWAFVHELPKGGGINGLANMNSAWRMLEASSWGKIASFAELLTVIDGGRGDVENIFIEQGEPHPDALVIGAAVAALGHCEVAIPAGWNALADWPDADGLAEQASALTIARYLQRPAASRQAGIVSLVIGSAILGRAPDWSAEPSKVRFVERAGRPAWFVKRSVPHEDGKAYELEVDGFNARTGRPMRGAYRKQELSVNPAGDILSRLDWQIWVAALRRLSAVGSQMEAHRVEPCGLSMTPWLASEGVGVALVDRGERAASKKTLVAC